MLSLKSIRNILKVLAEDSRLRIVYLLNIRKLNVAELCRITGSKQSIISKHLTRLRYSGLVADRRDGQFIYYSLKPFPDPFLKQLMGCILKEVAKQSRAKNDLARLKKMKS